MAVGLCKICYNVILRKRNRYRILNGQLEYCTGNKHWSYSIWHDKLAPYIKAANA